MRDIYAGQVLPVIGPELVTITSADGQQISLYRHLAAELARRLKIPIPQGEQPTLNAVTCSWLLSGNACKEIYDEVRDLVDKLKAQPSRALLDLTSITDFALFISTTFDPLTSQALEQNNPGFLPEQNGLDFHPNNPGIFPRNCRHHFSFTSLAHTTPTPILLSGRKITSNISADCWRSRIICDCFLTTCAIKTCS